jgi:hypothetical protein
MLGLCMFRAPNKTASPPILFRTARHHSERPLSTFSIDRRRLSCDIHTLTFATVDLQFLRISKLVSLARHLIDFTLRTECHALLYSTSDERHPNPEIVPSPSHDSPALINRHGWPFRQRHYRYRYPRRWLRRHLWCRCHQVHVARQWRYRNLLQPTVK